MKRYLTLFLFSVVLHAQVLEWADFRSDGAFLIHTTPDQSITLVENFCGGGTASDASYEPIGILGWHATAAITRSTPTQHFQCPVSLPSGASVFTNYMRLAATGSNIFGELDLVSHWLVRFSFKKSAAADSDFIVGLADAVLTSAANLIAITWTSGDGTNLKFRACKASTCMTAVDTGIANSDTSVHTVRIYRLPQGATKICVDTCSSSTTIPSANIPTAGVSPFFQASHDSNAYSVQTNLFSAQMPR